MNEKSCDTRRDETSVTLAGVAFSDPYHWLEGETDEVRAWQRAQAQSASAHVREWPHFEQVRALVARFNTERPERGAGLPRYAAGRWFRSRVAPGTTHAQVVVSEGPFEDGCVVFDPATESTDRPPFLSWIVPSPDGRTLAVGICADGSENNTIRLIDVASGERLAESPPQKLMDNWTGGVQWLADSSGFFFSAITGAAVDFQQAVYLHRRRPTPSTHRVEVPWIGDHEYRMIAISREGSYAVALEGLSQVVPVAVAALDAAPLKWRPFVTSVRGNVAGHIVGSRYIAVTDVGAPRGRLVAIPLNADDPNDPQCWQELVSESDAVVRTVTPVAELLYLSELVDTYARVRIVDVDGHARGEVPLPGRGALSESPFPISALVPRGHPQQFLFGFSSLIASPGIYCHTPGEQQIETLREPQARLDRATVEDRWAVSSDGTRIPYHIVRPIDVSPYEPHPTLIYAYGGFNVPHVPQFPGPMAAFVAAGGVFVHAHLRGGGEFGLEWWQRGRLRNKQNGYQDLYAVAEDLIASKRCTPETLALSGGSNGGLMAGVALTQRPTLWKVVVPRVPILDLIGSCAEPYGRMCAMLEYANIDDSEEVRRLSQFSPYHLVERGVRYPAVYIDAGETDPRCPPWHARKFAARLQNASAGEAPILLHVWENVGHGWATDKSVAVSEHAEWLAFAMRHLSLTPSNAVAAHSTSYP